MAAKIDCFGVTDIGLRREVNEDHFLIADLSKSMRVHQSSLGIDCESRVYGGSQGHLFLVADGMGGEPEGRRASTLAIDGLTKYLLNSLPWLFRLEEDSEQDFEEELREAIRHCEETIATFAQHSGQKSMGTTLTMAYVVWPRAFIVHVGDSRCYLIRNGEIRALTRDHTMSSLMAERQGVADDDPLLQGFRHFLWNALGGDTGKPTIDVARLDLRQRDVLLLSTDGMHGVVPSSEILTVVDEAPEAEAACRELVAAAKEHDGGDNITAVVAVFGQPNAGPDEAFVEAEVPLDQMGKDNQRQPTEDDTVEYQVSS